MTDRLQDAGHPAVIARLMHDYGLTPKKSIGQNFFSDGALLDDIADAARIDGADTAFEIGPGLGALTQRLAVRARRVVAVEIDPSLLEPLGEMLAGCDNVEVLNRDFLKMSPEELAALFAPGERVHVVANLPYGITTLAVQKLLRLDLPIEDLTLLLQKEAAERVTASPGDKAYTTTAMMARYYTQSERLFDVPPDAFFPSPHVTSTLVRLSMRKPRPRPNCGDDFLWRVAQCAIAMRRKTIANNFKSAGFGAEASALALSAVGVDPTIRAETLDIGVIATLAEALFRNI